MTCMFCLLFQALLDIYARLFYFYLRVVIPVVKPPVQGENSPESIMCSYQLKTFIGSMKEIGDLLKLANSFWKPSRPAITLDKSVITGKVAVVTGGDEGVGRDTAIELAKWGFKVIIGVKDVESAEITIEKVKEDISQAQITAIHLDLSSLESVRKFANVVTEKETQIDLLVNSLDTFSNTKIKTRDGLELNLVENYLGHFLLTRLLLKSLTNAPSSRVINVTSTAHHFGKINFEDINYDKKFYPLSAYNQSKLAQVLFTRELSKRTKGSGINVYAVNPGILRHRIRFEGWYLLNEMLCRMSDPSIGVQAIVDLALNNKYQTESGHYYSNYSKVDYLSEEATNDMISEKLWNLSSNLVKLDK